MSDDIVHELKVRSPIALTRNNLNGLSLDRYIILSPQERDEVVAKIEQLKDNFGFAVEVERIVASAIAEERERCARVAEGDGNLPWRNAIAAAIRKGE